MKKKVINPKIDQTMTLWARSKLTFTYHFALAVIFNVVFWNFFGVRDLFITMDVLTYPTVLFNKLPWALACAVTFALAWITLDKFLGVLLNMVRVVKQDTFFIEMGNSVGVDGVQRIGKTRLLMYMAMVRLYPKFFNLRYNYYIDCPIAEELRKQFDDGVKWKYIRFKARKDAVNEYLKPDNYIPLIYSNIKELDLFGFVPRILTVNHFTMRERLYESNIKIGSELDNLLPNTMKKKDKLTSEEALNAKLVDEFSGLDGQYCDGDLFADTHRNGAIFIPIRDCQQMKIHISRKQHMYSPLLFELILRFLRKRVVNTTKEATSLKLRKACKWFEKHSRAIGFTKLYYFLEDGPAGATRLNKEEQFLILPNEVPYSYDDRGLQEDYIPLGYREMPAVEEKPEKAKRSKKKQSDEDNAA